MFNYLRHLCTRCPCFFRKLSGKVNYFVQPFDRSIQQLETPPKITLESAKNKPAKTLSASFDILVQHVGLNYISTVLSSLARRAGKRQTYQSFSLLYKAFFNSRNRRHLNLFLLPYNVRLICPLHKKLPHLTVNDDHPDCNLRRGHRGLRY